MANLEKLALLKEILDELESNIKQAKKVISEALGTPSESKRAEFKIDRKEIMEKAQALSQSEGKARIIQGVFDGQNMVAQDGTEYPVPANYASKSKIVQGDTLKLTISEDGSFVYKQIGPVERKKILGILSQDENGDYVVVADDKTYKVLLASVTYFKGEVGDEATLVVPQEGDVKWGAIENILKKKGSVKDMIRDKTEEKEEKEKKKDSKKKKGKEREVVPGQVIDDLDTDLEDNLEGLLDG